MTKDWGAIAGAALVGGLGMFLSGAALLITAVQGPVSSDRPGEQRGTFGTSVITVDVGTLPSTDCWVEVGVRDTDGHPDGDKIIETETLCP